LTISTVDLIRSLKKRVNAPPINKVPNTVLRKNGVSAGSDITTEAVGGRATRTRLGMVEANERTADLVGECYVEYPCISEETGNSLLCFLTYRGYAETSWAALGISVLSFVQSFLPVNELGMLCQTSCRLRHGCERERLG
jgi:hypothetical protein